MIFPPLTAMLALFCILKVLRGSDRSSTAEGGIWNYISLLYYPLFLYVLTKRSRYRIRAPFVCAFLYAFLAVLSALVTRSLQWNIHSLYSFLMLPYSVMVFFAFYLSSDRSPWGERILLAGYFGCLFLNLYTIAMFWFAGAEEAMESDIYFSLGLFPFALQLLRSKWLRAMAIAMEFLAVFMVNKRTALISFILALAIYFLVQAWLQGKHRFLAFIRLLLRIAFCMILFYAVSTYLDQKFQMHIYDRLFRLAEDGGSGRSEIYAKVWDGFLSSSPKEQLWGHGMNTAGALADVGQAHNDLLEILYDYGLIACLCAVGFYLSLIAEAFRLLRVRSPYAASFAVSVVIGSFLAMFSYFLIYYTYVTCIMAFWGYSLSLEQKRSLYLEESP